MNKKINDKISSATSLMTSKQKALYDKLAVIYEDELIFLSSKEDRRYVIVNLNSGEVLEDKVGDMTYMSIQLGEYLVEVDFNELLYLDVFSFEQLLVTTFRISDAMDNFLSDKKEYFIPDLISNSEYYKETLLAGLEKATSYIESLDGHFIKNEYSLSVLLDYLHRFNKMPSQIFYLAGNGMVAALVELYENSVKEVREVVA